MKSIDYILELVNQKWQHKHIVIEIWRTSGQNGGVGRYNLPPPTAKRRATTNLKTKSNQNSQKIELYGSPTTKELKTKHSSRLVGGAETGSQGREDTEKPQTGQAR